MRRNRAVAVASVGAAAALALAGCSTDSNSSSGSASGSKTLTVAGWSGDAVMKAVVAQFEKDNPGVKVKLTGYPWPAILTQINTQLVSGTAADVDVVFPGNGNPITAQTLAKGKYLADLSAESWASNFNEATKNVMSADGKVLMVANNSTIIPATYNTQALKAIGKTAPTTWSQVLGLCSAAKAKGKVAYAMAGLAGGTFNYLPYTLTATLVYGPNPGFSAQQAAGKATFSDSQWTTALTKYQQMLKAGCFTKDSLGTSLDVAQKQVATGGALGIVTVSNQIVDIQKDAPSGTTFETAALPATDDPSQTVLPVGLGAGYGVNAKGNVALGKKFLDFYMSKKGMDVAVKAGSIFPSTTVEGFKPTPALAGVSDQVHSDKTAAFPDQTWPNANVTQVYQDELQKLLGGQASVKDVLAAMDAAYKG
ncbi:ABC transporter substrate-binding protein [Streptomyces sp. NPDC058457]|uniref:ABC transporter substrate-binding protein n=1 Tax=Streptomyces sp. NPDC058457 TaxID=3346507 RepID=UPI00365E7BD0